jgi:hypothetical protein
MGIAEPEHEPARRVARLFSRQGKKTTPVTAAGALPQAPCAAAPVAALPDVVRIRQAFAALPPSATELRVLRALAENPGRDSVFLSRVCGWHGAIWHTHLAAICHRRMKWLFADGAAGGGAHDFLYGSLAHYDPAGAAFTMREEAEAALRSLGIIAPH